MNDALAPAPGRLREILREGPFMRYLAGEAVSMTGTWMQVMAQSWVMTTLTTSALMLGMTHFAMGVPMIALSMAGGVFADRHDRRTILVVTQVVQISLALWLGWLAASGRIQTGHILAAAFFLGISNSFEMPAVSALVPELVRPNQVAAAVALDRSVFHGTRLIGPALAGIVVGAWGAGAAFFLNALSFLALIAALASLPARPKATAAEEQARREGGLKPGLAFVRSDAPTLGMIALMAATTLLVFPMMIVLLPYYARYLLHLNASQMGLLMAISSLGSFAGSASLLAAPRARRRGLMMAAVGGIFLAMTGLSQARSLASAAVCLVFLSLGVSTLIGLANTIVQERAPNALRGRVSAIAGLSFFGLMPFASIGATATADALGLRPVLLGAAVLYLAVAAAILLRRPAGLNQPASIAASPNLPPPATSNSATLL